MMGRNAADSVRTMSWGASWAGLVLGAGAALGAPAEYAVSTSPAGGTLTTSVTVSTDATGTLRGNYDAATNPTGTRTLPGFLQNCGSNPNNTPIPFSLTGGTNGSATTNPTASFILGIDEASGAVTISGLSLDLIGSASDPSLPVNVDLTIGQSFTTCNPNSTYLAATVPVSLGEATLTDLTATQTPGTATGTLTLTGPGTFEFAVSVEVAVSGAVVLGTTPNTLTQTVTVPVTGTGTLSNGGQSVSVTVALTLNLSQTDPGPTPGATDAPLAVPTILPPGNTANLLASFTLTDTSVAISATGGATASGSRAAEPADFNGDGTVDASDITAFLGAWFADRTNGTLNADFNDSGATDASDITAFLAAWFDARG